MLSIDSKTNLEKIDHSNATSLIMKNSSVQLIVKTLLYFLEGYGFLFPFQMLELL